MFSYPDISWVLLRCDMAFIEPMHRNKPNITWVLLNVACRLSFNFYDGLFSPFTRGTSKIIMTCLKVHYFFCCSSYLILSFSGWFCQIDHICRHVGLTYFVRLLVFLLDMSVLEIKRFRRHWSMKVTREGDFHTRAVAECMKPDWFRWLCCKLISGKCFKP